MTEAIRRQLQAAGAKLPKAPPNTQPRSVSHEQERSAPTTSPKEPELAKVPQNAFGCRVSQYDFQNGTDRIVFVDVPKDQTQAFITHCQSFQP